MKDTQKDFLKKVNGGNEVPFVSQGIAADASGFIISENAITTLVESAMNNESAIEKVNQLTTELGTANTAKKTAEDNLAAANNTIAEKDAEIVALKAKLDAKEEEGADFEETTREKDKLQNGKEPFHLSATNPMNKLADSLFGVPVNKK